MNQAVYPYQCVSFLRPNGVGSSICRQVSLNPPINGLGNDLGFYNGTRRLDL